MTKSTLGYRSLQYDDQKWFRLVEDGDINGDRTVYKTIFLVTQTIIIGIIRFSNRFNSYLQNAVNITLQEPSLVVIILDQSKLTPTDIGNILRHALSTFNKSPVTGLYRSTSMLTVEK